MKVLIGCERSGVVRRAFRERGHDAWSCDLVPADDGSQYHIQGDAIEAAYSQEWDLGIFHPDCTRLTNAGVRWLHEPPEDKTLEQLWFDLHVAVQFYKDIREAPIPRKAIENPVMHKYARWMTGAKERQVVQPWWFGDPFFKATGFELICLPELVATNKLTPPKTGTDEHKAWSMVHRASPGPDRARIRSETFPGVAAAMADQWSYEEVLRYG